MRVFVAGATGAIGRVLVPRLVAAGHDVVGTTRSEVKAAALRALGAAPVVCDVLDASAVTRAAVDARPDVVVNELTDLPRAQESPKLRYFFDENDRVQREGTKNLLGAARAAGARRYVAQSIAYFYAPAGDALRTEDDPLYVDAPPPVGEAVRAQKDAEDLALSAPEIAAVLLRYGVFYGPGTWYAKDGDIGRRVRDRKYPIVGTGNGHYSFIHVDDAAAATALFVERGAPGVYNVVDDDPAPANAWMPAYAAALGAPAPMRLPAWIARLPEEKAQMTWATELRGAANGKAKNEVGWTPKYASWRRGFVEACG